MRRPNFPHPSIYNGHHIWKFLNLPAPQRYTPTHAPGYCINTSYPTGTITRLAEPPPFPLQKAVVNSMYEIDCVMVGPGALILRTPRLDEFKPWFYRVDFEQIFGHQSLGVTPNFPREYIPDSLLLATGVQAREADWEPSEYTKQRWEEQGKYSWVNA